MVKPYIPIDIDIYTCVKESVILSKNSFVTQVLKANINFNTTTNAKASRLPSFIIAPYKYWTVIAVPRPHYECT